MIRPLLRFALGLVLPFSAAAQSQTVPPAVEAFFSNPAFVQARLSPDGQRLAATVATKAGRVQLAVFTVGKWDESRVVAGFEDADVNAFTWINDNRLVFDM